MTALKHFFVCSERSDTLALSDTSIMSTHTGFCAFTESIYLWYDWHAYDVYSHIFCVQRDHILWVCLTRQCCLRKLLCVQRDHKKCTYLEYEWYVYDICSQILLCVQRDHTLWAWLHTTSMLTTQTSLCVLRKIIMRWVRLIRPWCLYIHTFFWLLREIINPKHDWHLYDVYSHKILWCSERSLYLG